MKTSTRENTSLIKSIVALFFLAGIAATASTQTTDVSSEADMKTASPYNTIVPLENAKAGQHFVQSTHTVQ